MTDPTDDLDRDFDAAVRGAYRAPGSRDDAARARLRGELRARAERPHVGSRVGRWQPAVAFAALAACVALGAWIGTPVAPPSASF